jgi:hypothetical protein
MGILEARKLLAAVSTSSRELDEGILEYLLSVVREGTAEDRDDLLFSLVPDLSALAKPELDRLLKKLYKTSFEEDVVPMCAPRDDSSSNNVFLGAFKEKSEEHFPGSQELRTILDEYGYQGDNPIDSDTMSYLYGFWATPDVESEDKLELIRSYIDIDSVGDDDKAAALLKALSELFDAREGSGDDGPSSSSSSSSSSTSSRAAAGGHQGFPSQQSASDKYLEAMEEIKNDVREKKTYSEEELKERKLLVKQQGFGAIVPKYDEKGKPPAGKPLVMFVQNDKQQSKLRYRDGQVVASKGEKYIVTKEEEYDGGSRGRVKSKGKRGAGVGGGWGKK